MGTGVGVAWVADEVEHKEGRGDNWKDTICKTYRLLLTDIVTTQFKVSPRRFSSYFLKRGAFFLVKILTQTLGIQYYAPLIDTILIL